ncbi:MAG: TetR/AcrR family transcriptional regulator [Hyphomonadaceae bacterium]|nr:TetR/AcrR family transcriptional regulator [Hyphomonadaceae bacterium]
MTKKTPAKRSEAREPKQGRSRASLERMVEAATALLRERAGPDFTLNEVSSLGRVSIGSIYCRFESKEVLIREVHARTMVRFHEDEMAMLDRLRKRGDDLDTLIPAIVSDLAEFLKARAPILSAFMVSATSDAAIAAAGGQAYRRAKDAIVELILEHRREIARPDPERAADAFFHLVYAALARHLGLGHAPIAEEMGWARLKEELGVMGLAYLKARERKPVTKPQR